MKHREDGGKTIEAKFDFEGGNPGHDHAWVSWLYHYKMQDWRRLDEQFTLQEGDKDDEWLMGSPLP